jgi:hypothetical protein
MRFATHTVRLTLDVPNKSGIIDKLLSAKSSLESNPADMFALQEISWLVDAIAAVEDPDSSRHVDACLQMLAIGDVTFMAFPGETFTAFGLTLREKFPNLRLLTVNTANGLVGYIPTTDDFDTHGYASHNAPHIYNIFAFERGFGEHLCAEAEELLISLRG